MLIYLHSLLLLIKEIYMHRPRYYIYNINIYCLYYVTKTKKIKLSKAFSWLTYHKEYKSIILNLNYIFSLYLWANFKMFYIYIYIHTHTNPRMYPQMILQSSALWLRERDNFIYSPTSINSFHSETQKERLEPGGTTKKSLIIITDFCVFALSWKIHSIRCRFFLCPSFLFFLLFFLTFWLSSFASASTPLMFDGLPTTLLLFSK